jgi:hypothetical protein
MTTAEDPNMISAAKGSRRDLNMGLLTFIGMKKFRSAGRNP